MMACAFTGPIPGRTSNCSLLAVLMLTFSPDASFTPDYYGLFVEGLFQGFEQRFLTKNIRDTLTAKVFFDSVNGLSSAQHFFHEHGSNTSQSGLCKGVAEDASGATRSLISSEST